MATNGADAPLLDKSTEWKGLGGDSAAFNLQVVVVVVGTLVYMLSTDMDYAANTTMQTPSYVMFIDVSIMIFFGFGFLMTFLRRNGYSAVGLCLMVSAVVVLESIVVEDVLKRMGLLVGDTWGEVSLFNLINGLFCAGAVMISMGAVLGKVSPSQLMLMGLIETVLYWISFSIYTVKVGAQDAAGGIVLHAFGAYFGLTVAKIFTTPASLEAPDNASIYSSDLFSLAGTLFLWLLWPSFCAAVAPSEAEAFFAVVNTFLALVGSIMGFAVVSRVMHGNKFNVVEAQNATLAGGVAMGVPSIVRMGPAYAIIIGVVAGSLSTFGYAKLDLGEMLGLSDTCGVNNLHGMPGLLSGLTGLVFFNAATQLAGMAITLGIAIGGGVFTAMAMKALPSLEDSGLFGDEPFWEVADDYKLE